MTTSKIPVRTVYDNSNNPVGLAEFQHGEVVSIEHGGTNANTVADAKINLSLDNANVRALITVAGAGTYDNSTGVITINGGVTSVAGGVGAVSNAVLLAGLVTQGISTSDVVEGSRLYYSNDRVSANVATLGYSSNSYVNTRLNTKANVTDLTTSNVIELNNLYYTDVRAFANLLSASTTSLSEGSNLYFTNTRAINALVNSDVSARNLTLSGNLTVNGNTTFLNVESLTVEDKNILLANGAASAAASDGSGITVDGSFASLTYKNTGNKWSFDRDLEVVGGISATDWSGLYSDNVIESTNLYFTNARAISALTGGENISIAANGRITAEIADTVTTIPFTNTNVNFYETKSLLVLSKNTFRSGEYNFNLDDGVNYVKHKHEVIHNGTSVAYSNSKVSLGDVDAELYFYIQNNSLILEAINGNYYVDDYYDLSEQYQSNATINVKGHVFLIET